MQNYEAVRILEKQWGQRYLEALRYARRYHTGWEQAQAVYRRFQAFKEEEARERSSSERMAA